jgi:two-component system, OmpR family, sensor histidine kinase TctE
VRAVAIDLSPLIADHELDFDIETAPAPVRAHEWALRELTRNLLHNAIKLSRPQGRLGVRLAIAGGQATLSIADSGPGIAPELRQRLFQPFASGDPRSGSGLGLAICQEIVSTLGGEIRLDNRSEHGRITGLDAVVSLPLADNPAT